MLNLLLRFYDPTAGRVLLDGTDLRSIQRGSFRSHCALVQQETFLFNDSILDNIRYGDPDATMERVQECIHAAHVAEFLDQHPDATWLSAGMSGDLEAAIGAGATHVRVGSAILGPRPQDK